MTLEDCLEFLEDISRCEIVTLATDTPAIKPKILQKIVTQSLNLGKQVHYFDLDLQFSSLLQNLSDDEYAVFDTNRLALIQPRNHLDWYFPFVGEISNSGLIILDSINTVQNLLANELSSQDTSGANHHSAVLLSILQNLARFYSKNIIAINLMRSRPRLNQDQSSTWYKQLVGGRMVRFKSDAVLYASTLLHELQDSARATITVREVLSPNFGGSVGDIYNMTE